MHNLAEPDPQAAPLLHPPQRISRGCWFWAGWEPDRYYRRIGARATPYFGNGDWVQPWREHLESKACLESLAQVGATVLVTRFYKGFGPEIEREDWPSLGRFVQRAHEVGIQVWGYLQGQSLFGEFLFNERPEASAWVAQTSSGTPQLWAGAYNRYAPCLSNLAYREMMEDLVKEGLESLDLDGIHMDNNYYRHCYCPRCKDLFREWLTERGDLEERTGIPSADFIEPPPLSAEASLIPDPLAILWIEFSVQVRSEFMQAIREKMRASKAEATLAGNPAFLRAYPSRLTHAVDPVREGALCDSVCVENGNQPRFENGKLFTQADKHLFAEAAGLKTWATSWRPGPYGSSPPASPAGLWSGLAEEFSFANAFLGNNWALRPAGDGNKLLLEPLADEWKTFVEATRFFQSLDERLVDRPRHQWGEVAIYVDSRALAICPNSDARALQVFLLSAISHKLPFKIVLHGQPVPKETHTVLVVQQRALEEAEILRLANETQQNGAALWMIGDCGIYDEWCVPRSQTLLNAWKQLPHLHWLTITPGKWLEKENDSGQYLKGQSPELSEIAKIELDEIFSRLSSRQVFQVESPEGVLSNIERLGDDGWLVHLRNLSDTTTTDVRIRFRPVGGSQVKLSGYSPQWPETLDVPHTREGDRLMISVPAFASYAGVLISLA